MFLSHLRLSVKVWHEVNDLLFPFVKSIHTILTQIIFLMKIGLHVNKYVTPLLQQKTSKWHTYLHLELTWITCWNICLLSLNLFLILTHNLLCIHVLIQSVKQKNSTTELRIPTSNWMYSYVIVCLCCIWRWSAWRSTRWRWSVAVIISTSMTGLVRRITSWLTSVRQRLYWSVLTTTCTYVW